jgi:hypothetical protein
MTAVGHVAAARRRLFNHDITAALIYERGLLSIGA